MLRMGTAIRSIGVTIPLSRATRAVRGARQRLAGAAGVADAAAGGGAFLT